MLAVSLTCAIPQPSAAQDHHCFFTVLCRSDARCIEDDYAFSIVAAGEAFAFVDDDRRGEMRRVRGSELTTYVELNARGDLMVLSVAADGVAAYSKNASLAGQLFAVQYHGKCTVAP